MRKIQIHMENKHHNWLYLCVQVWRWTSWPRKKLTMQLCIYTEQHKAEQAIVSAYPGQAGTIIFVSVIFFTILRRKLHFLSRKYNYDNIKWIYLCCYNTKNQEYFSLRLSTATTTNILWQIIYCSFVQGTNNG
jgi:hypothetical protein